MYKPHSFPTRRSSDLGAGLITNIGHGFQRYLISIGKIYIKIPEIFNAAFVFIRKAYHQVKADRKSTRLNSSHVAISYAVFCLKKKTIVIIFICIFILILL